MCLQRARRVNVRTMYWSCVEPFPLTIEVVAKSGIESPDASLLPSTLTIATALFGFGNDPAGPLSVIKKTPVL